jgi:hypothetical protein
MSSKPAYLITPAGISLFLAGVLSVIPTDHPNYAKILDALKNEDFGAIPALSDLRTSVRNFLATDKDFALVNDLITFKGTPYSPAITSKVLAMIDAGHSADPIFKFLRKVEQNPSAAARNELLLFCVANGFLIDLDGNIVAYKSVQESYRDIHSGRVFYKPVSLMTDAEKAEYATAKTAGNVTMQIVDGELQVSMPRNAVDDDRDRTCSYGLHFASHEYASTWAGRGSHRLLVMLVNPANVVSIPSDYNNQKGRAAVVTPIAEIGDFAKLPHKEVYTPQDLANGVGVKAVDNTAELERKRKVLAKVEARILDRADRINQIIALGGDATNLSDEQMDDEDLADELEQEIEDLS